MSSEQEVQQWVRRRLAQEAWMRELEDEEVDEEAPASLREAS